ncbi:MAG: gluconolactonase [Bacteroidetes bacterium]|nr:MAG: gluconolactonase [Bacteroidota bacterium]PTM14205.1 MAG: gluconolactonase [Bacteroidota bacterium]
MKTVLLTLATLVAIGLLYLLFWPTPVAPSAWEAPPNPGFTGRFAQNDRLAKVDLLHLSCHECEDVAIDAQGRVYGGTVDGRILRYAAPGAAAEVLANTQGWPLGLDFDTSGNLYIADAYQGLLRLTPTGQLETLSTEYQGDPYGFTDDLEVGPDGRVYFSDASNKWPVAVYKFDILEHCAAGRLLVYDPVSQTVELLADGLYFANGIAVAADTSFVLVNETSNYRVLKYWLTGAQKGTTEILIDNLPAFPDGISRGSDGIFWLALVSPRNPLLDKWSAQPFLRKLIARLPSWLQPAPEKYGAVLGLNSQGEVVYNLQDPAGKYEQVTSVQQWGNDLYLGSLGRDGVGWLKNFRQQ